MPFSLFSFRPKDRWISVNDRFPQRLFAVLLCDIDGNVSEGWLNGSDNTFYVHTSNEDDMEFENVSYWMPLPAPPIR